MAEAPRLRLIGWGPFRLPGEARRWSEAEDRARQVAAGLTGPAPGPSATDSAATTAAVAERVPDSSTPAPPTRRVMAPLTADERDLLELLAEGYSVSQIAKERDIHPRTVTTRVLGLSQKTGRTDQAGFAELLATIRLAEARTPEP
jgi:DNA-binding NarL/FixJ family response regulator